MADVYRFRRALHRWEGPTGSLPIDSPGRIGSCGHARGRDPAPGVLPADIEDVILGCAMPEAEQGLTSPESRAASRFLVELSRHHNRLAHRGLQAIAFAADRIKTIGGRHHRGGTESMSLVPMGGHKVRLPRVVDSYPMCIDEGLVARITRAIIE